MEGGRVRQLHEGLAARFCESDGREETRVQTANLYLGEMQPGRDLQ